MERKTLLCCLIAGVFSSRASSLDLTDFKTRLGRQFGGGKESVEGGVALGLVNALQKWANTLESQISTLRSEVHGLKNSNVQLVEEMQQAKSLNINLKNEIQQANERSMNVKNNYQRVKEDMVMLKEENMNLKDILAQHSNVIKSIQEHIQTNRQHHNENKKQIGNVKTNLSSLQGASNKRFLELEEASNVLSSELSNVNKTIAATLKTQMNTMKGLERLGDNVAATQGKTSRDIEAAIERLSNQSTAIVEEVSQVSADIGRIDQVVLKLKQGEQEAKKNVEKLTQNFSDTVGELKNEIDRLAAGAKISTKTVQEIKSEMGSVSAQSTATKSSDDVLKTVQTLKSNVIGLGNYINSINRELHALSETTGKSVETINKKVAVLTRNVTMLEGKVTATRKLTSEFKNEVSSGDFVTSTLRTDVAGLSTKLYSIKTSVFELTNDISSLKAGLTTTNTDVNKVNDKIKNLSNKILTTDKKSSTAKSDVTTLRSGLTGLTNSVYSIKAKVDKFDVFGQKVADLTEDVDGMNAVMTVTRAELDQMKPEVDLIATDISTMRNKMSRMTGKVNALADPPRFSCGVTGDEIKVSGVITYDECNVNTNKMMNRATGHATAPVSGDYVLSFTANMVSADSQAIWCALYKQSPGEEGWQVLGMINNYQRDAVDEDDRDSGSVTLVSPLKSGDQVWVEWRGYGDSYLYSNPYKLISFTGYMITRDV